ncbi:MAG: UDP-2-acetamido-3-amino-2,3-dideoxy-glucuronate N-acetyltransferase [Sphingobacteriales bacterium]|jgi:UDP-2-acetamido-3-amino-2,3-dideoxy-glucuronate N-acetyltransferase
MKKEKDYYHHHSAIIDEGTIIGTGTRIWHFSHIMKDCKVGQNCNIGQNVVVSPGATVGNNVKIQNNVSVYTKVNIEDDVFLGPSMVFTNVKNPRSAIERKDQFTETNVRKGATIGANATIICGLNINEYAFIGAGAVVTKDIAAYALVVGNPSQQIGWVSKGGLKLEFDANGKATCPEFGDSYELRNGKVSTIS